MITFATTRDTGDIMDFIDREWRKGHILARDRAFFTWMYAPAGDGRVNFVISRNENGEIDGLLGFIPYDREGKQISLALWKALKSAGGMVGMGMLAFLEKELQPQAIATPGVNPGTTGAIYKYFKYAVGKMDHRYRSADRTDFRLAEMGNASRPAAKDAENVRIREITAFEEYEQAGIRLMPNALQKEAWYIRRRYFEHPVFHYQHRIIEDDAGKLDVVTRVQEAEGASCLRVVDLLGDVRLLPAFTGTLDALIAEGGHEYADCYAAGIPKELWDEAGWLDPEETGSVIPNYFAPFERRNIEIWYSSKPANIVLLRGDGDQDRP